MYRIPKSGPAPHWCPDGVIKDGIQLSQFTYGPLCWELITGKANHKGRGGGFESRLRIEDLRGIDHLSRLCNNTYVASGFITDKLKETFSYFPDGRRL